MSFKRKLIELENRFNEANVSLLAIVSKDKATIDVTINGIYRQIVCDSEEDALLQIDSLKKQFNIKSSVVIFDDI
ncbi:hypothetical protein [Neofamilia massiliensis]|uniref:hypothetical protein n=1 Tax=Neofamilia massiliensis TaxID=1673724 RepID=UPI0006BB664A|nr:hypothetical protein [Neofamilia massiliensis]